MKELHQGSWYSGSEFYFVPHQCKPKLLFFFISIRFLSLTSASFRMTTHEDLSSVLFLHVLTPIDFRHSQQSLSILILVFMLLFFRLVPPEMLS